MADEAFALIDAADGVPLRASLERSRLSALASLVEPEAERITRGGLAAQRSPAYRDRLLLAALGGLNSPSPAPARAAPTDLGPEPLVEPLPRLHAQLAFAARRIARALEEVSPGHNLLAIAQLRRLARLEEALRDASLDLLAGRAVPAGTRQELRALCPLFQAWVPRDPRSRASLLEVPTSSGEVELLQRVTTRVDRLYLIGRDSASGRPALGCGPALMTVETLRVGGVELSELSPDHPLCAEAPAWASHVEAR